MSAKPVQISLEPDLLERIDRDPETLEKGRSAFIRNAVRSYFRSKERAAIDARIRAAYGGRADAMLAEVSDLLGRQAWPRD